MELLLLARDEVSLSLANPHLINLMKSAVISAPIVLLSCSPTETCHSVPGSANHSILLCKCVSQDLAARTVRVIAMAIGGDGSYAGDQTTVFQCFTLSLNLKMKHKCSLRDLDGARKLNDILSVQPFPIDSLTTLFDTT
jgi:hypothetical protein